MPFSSSLAGQLILCGVPGPELDAETRERLRRVQPGGYIIFGRNIKSARQLRRLLDDLRGISEIEPIVTIDQEGGRVSRLKLLGNEPPNAKQIRETGNLQLVEAHGRITAGLLRLFGFNLDLCPVLDIAFEEDADNSVRGRCWGCNAEETIENASAFHQALVAGGVLGCGKHFPGYSAAPVDPHEELPTILRSREELEDQELAVFRHFSSGSQTIASMMVGHGFYPALQEQKGPSSLDPAVVSGLLKQELGFQGLIMTDDLDMGAILNERGFAETITGAVHAGNHMVMICHRLEMVEEASALLQKQPKEVIQSGVDGVLRFKKQLQVPTEFSEAAFARLDEEVWDLRVQVLGEDLAASRSPEDGKRSPVELY
ncbi:MAG: glycoside hydrolase family 3 N-terminal domain-containing protein [Verrucomicrobiales bacterium]